MENVPDKTRRIIDANLNRTGEGLRFLEDVGRLLLDDSDLSQQLKNLRHDLVRGDVSFNRRLLQSRDSEGDVGVDLEVPGEARQKELPDAVVANSRRVQESLRVLEEMAKLPGTALDPEKFKHARFTLYTLEKKLLFRLLRRGKIDRLRGLYVIIDTPALQGRSHLEVAGEVIRGGAKVIQLRDKRLAKKELISVARQLKDLCAEQGVLFIVNDYLDVALAVDADGLHLGEDDLPVEVARRLLPGDKILGGSARTVEGATAAQAAGADYLGVGAMYSTPTKETAEVVGPERLRRIKQAITVPVVAIGGINRDNAAAVVAAGADAVAVISAVLGADNVAEATRQLVAGIEEANGQDDR